MTASVGLNEETFRVSTHSESSLNNKSVNKIQFWNSSRSGNKDAAELKLLFQKLCKK